MEEVEVGEVIDEAVEGGGGDVEAVEVDGGEGSCGMVVWWMSH